MINYLVGNLFIKININISPFQTAGEILKTKVEIPKGYKIFNIIHSNRINSESVANNLSPLNINITYNQAGEIYYKLLQNAEGYGRVLMLLITLTTIN